MRYYKQLSDNYILAIGTGSGNTEITETEYNQILSIIQNRPQTEGKESKDYPRFRYGGGLWKICSPHTFSEEWVPGMATASLYTRIEIEHTGTKEDPIPWAQNMVLYKDKYYTQNNVLYLCIRDSGNSLAYELNALIGLYVQVVEEVE